MLHIDLFQLGNEKKKEEVKFLLGSLGAMSMASSSLDFLLCTTHIVIATIKVIATAAAIKATATTGKSDAVSASTAVVVARSEPSGVDMVALKSTLEDTESVVGSSRAVVVRGVVGVGLELTVVNRGGS